MIIEHGRRYITRSGKTTGPLTINDKLDYPVVGQVEGEPYCRSWQVSGSYTIDKNAENASDLVAIAD
jgi:hypothetical protein